MSDIIEYLKGELAKAEANEREEALREQMREAARQTRAFLDAMAEQGITEDRAWELILTAIKK